MDLPEIRKDIHAEHKRATTTADREALLGVHKAIMDAAERHIRAEDLKDFREVRSQDYRLLLIQEAIIGDNSGTINPRRMAAITRREVEAGRMAPNDEPHELAVAGATVLTPLPTRMKPTLLTRPRGFLFPNGSA